MFRKISERPHQKRHVAHEPEAQILGPRLAGASSVTLSMLTLPLYPEMALVPVYFWIFHLIGVLGIGAISNFVTWLEGTMFGEAP